MNKKRSIKEDKNNKKDYLRYPKNKNVLFYLTTAFSFLISFVVYILTLAPSVTLEDSGELITAAVHLGVPHEPGYPLFTILGKLFSFFPIGDMAYRLNLMSAFFSTLAAVFVCITTVLIIENAVIKSTGLVQLDSLPFRILRYGAGLFAALLFAFSFENWEQSIITEVYGLHGFFVSLFILLVALWSRKITDSKKERIFYLICFITGLALTNHSTSILFIPVVLIYILVVDYKFLLNLKLLGFGLLSGLAGLIPLIYLPLSSSRNPVIDWGNPETLTNFIRTIRRHQYTELAQTSEKFSDGLHFYFGNLLLEQWWPFLLLLLIPALIMLYNINRKMLYFILLFLLFYIPVTTYLTDFEVVGKGYYYDLNRLLVSVFYIPSYLMIAVLIGIGLYYGIGFLKNKYIKYSILGLSMVLPFLVLSQNYQWVDMSSYTYPRTYLDNLFQVVSEDALVITQVDYFYFPAMYYQKVEGKRPDVTVLDQPLLKRTWYLDMLKVHEAEFIKRSKPAVDEFLNAVAPFEAGESYNGGYIESKYMGMINSFIDQTLNRGYDVFFTYIPQKEILRNYVLESVLGAYKLSKTHKSTEVKLDDLNFKEFQGINQNDPLLVRTLSDYYGSLFILRATWYEAEGKPEEALKYYLAGLEFYIEKPASKNFVKQRIKEIGKFQ